MNSTTPPQRPYFVASEPLPIAIALVAELYNGILYWQGNFLVWQSGAYRHKSDDAIRAEIYTYLEESRMRPANKLVSEVLAAMKAITHLNDDTRPGILLSRPSETIEDLLAVTNGMLRLDTNHLDPPNPDVFTLHSLPVIYNQTAPQPTQWISFLESIWPHDQESVETLQEIFGYMLTPWGSLQKIFLMVGPKRAGKGTIFRTLASLLGTQNVAAPTLSSLSEQFGMQNLIGKLVALVSDARIGNKTNLDAVTERLLSISGEDYISIPRKFRQDYTGKVSTRFLLATNELPILKDSSGALASRFVILKLHLSFYGSEDQDLSERIKTELPGILNWAIKGRERLKRRGKFKQPRSGIAAIKTLQELGNPIEVFLEEECEVGVGYSVSVNKLYSAYRDWCATGGFRASDKRVFGRDLFTTLHNLGKKRRNRQGSRTQEYVGIQLAGHHSEQHS